MRDARWLDSLTPLQRSLAEALGDVRSIAVGNFDGFHRGHQAILAAGGPACALLSFDRSAKELFDPAAAPGRIYTPAALATFAAPLITVPFTKEVASLSPADFAEVLRGIAVYCGEDWRFGKGAQGTPAMVGATVVPYAEWQGERISSTRIRQALAEGKMTDAAAMLGRNWSYAGTVVHGRGLANPTFGVPTLNVPYTCPSGLHMTPLARGVYHATAKLSREGVELGTWPALVNFGTAPSLKGEPEPLFEAHLLGASGDFYGATAEFTFATDLVRSERKFESLDALRAQIMADLATFKENL